MSRRRTLLCLSATLAMTGCASIVHEANYPVAVSSTPAGATVVVRDHKGEEVQRATTPVLLRLDSGSGYFRRARYSFSLEKPGYVPAQLDVGASLNPWYLGNVIFGGLPGLLIVDPATGSMWRLEESVTGALAPLPGYTPPVAAQPVPAAVAPVVPLAAPAENAAPVAAEVSALPPPAAVAPAPAPALAPAPAPAAPPPPAKSVGERLKDLKVLRDEGTLTEQEYQAKRAQLIESL